MGDNKPISKSDLRNLFGSLLGSSSSSASTSKDASAAPGSELASGEDYRKSNQTLVIRNCQLKTELSKIKKEMDSLRFENESLRDRLTKMETATEDERIEMIVSQRVESRVKQLKFMVDRSVKFLQKTSMDLNGVFGDIDEQQENISSATNDRKSTQPLARKPALSRVEESPLRRSSTTQEEVLPSLPSVPPTFLPSETPRVEHPRRGKSPIRIRPRTPKRERGATPTPSSPPPPHGFDGVLDSARRKRSATLKIQSFKEPSLGTKLRRPAGFDPAKDYI